MSDPEYMYVALLRVTKSKNENTGLKPRCIRMIGNQTHAEMIRRITLQCDSPGMWRIYRSVNRRDFAKAKKQLQIDLIVRDDVEDRISSHWKSILMSPKCRADKNFLIDVDTKNLQDVEKVKETVKTIKGVHVLRSVVTPNGCHIVTTPFNPKLLKDFDYVEVKHDALLFQELFVVDEVDSE